MNAKARTARQIVKARRTETRDARRPHTMISHAIRAGVPAADAKAVGGVLRLHGKKSEVPCKKGLVKRTANGKTQRGQVCYRYSKSGVVQALRTYKPRAERFIAARSLLLAYCAA